MNTQTQILPYFNKSIHNINDAHKTSQKYIDLTSIAEKLRFCDNVLSSFNQVKNDLSYWSESTCTRLLERQAEWETEKNSQLELYQAALPEILNKLQNQSILFQCVAFYNRHLYGDPQGVANKCTKLLFIAAPIFVAFAIVNLLLTIAHLVASNKKPEDSNSFSIILYTLLAIDIAIALIAYSINLAGLYTLRNHFQAQPNEANHPLVNVSELSDELSTISN